MLFRWKYLPDCSSPLTIRIVSAHYPKPFNFYLVVLAKIPNGEDVQFSNGTLNVNLPVEEGGEGHPDCINWDVQLTCTLDKTFTVMTITGGGTTCGAGGGSELDVEECILQKQ
jgi:hypothetical protein